MLTVSFLIAVELWLYASVNLALPETAETGLLLLLLGGIALSPSHDIRSGFAGRLLLVMGILWWWGSIPRLLDAMATAYAAAPGPIGEAVALMGLIIVPAGMVAAPAVEYLPKVGHWRPWEA